MAFMTSDYGFIIIGGGTAGFAGALRANKKGIRTALISTGPVGGTCINTGCMPSKALVSIAEAYFRERSPLIPPLSPRLDYRLDIKEVIEEKDRIVKDLREIRHARMMNELDHVDYIEAPASFLDPHTLKVGNERYTGDKFLIATGSLPSAPPIKGLTPENYLTSDQAISPSRLPRSMIVIGGRSTGLELAQFYGHMGTKVIVLQRSKRILPEHEPEISEHLTKYLKDDGIDVIAGMEVREITFGDGLRTVHFDVDGAEAVSAEELLLATGRRPNTGPLHLERARVKLDDHRIIVDRSMRTSNPDIYAAGDVTGEPMLETLASQGGRIATENALSGADIELDKSVVPTAVFTTPTVATVGLTESEARNAGLKCMSRTLPLSRVPKTRLTGDPRGLVKIVADSETHRVLGIHILASEAADIIHLGALAVKTKLTLENIADLVYVYPTVSEGIKLAAQSFFDSSSKFCE